MKKKVYEKPTIRVLAILPMQMIASSGGSGNGGGSNGDEPQIIDVDGYSVDGWEQPQQQTN